MLSSSPIHKPRLLLDASTFQCWASVLLVFLVCSLVQAAPIVSNLTAAQRVGTKLVDISYDLDVAAPVKITVEISSDGGQSYFVPAYALTGDVGIGVTGGQNKGIIWDAGEDWAENISEQMVFRIVADDLSDGFSYIPEGPFTMGRTSGDVDTNAVPVSVNVKGFLSQQTETTKVQWDEIRAWGLSKGYSDMPSREGKGADYPVHSISWWDAVKWCNARSEKEGLNPCYTVGGQVFRTGKLAPDCDWSASGYRLPTEAEWEKLARGGRVGTRFPWGDTINLSQANYYSTTIYEYDINPPRGGGYPYQFVVGNHPYNSPVGSFDANGYALFDVSGNVSEWCWDYYSPNFYGNIADNPKGPESGINRVWRGGSYDNYAVSLRCSDRDSAAPDYSLYGRAGFRVIRGSMAGKVLSKTSLVGVDFNSQQTITFESIQDKLATDVVYLSATGGGSGNPVTFEVTSGPGVITNNVMTFTTSGSVTVTASQAGNDDYLAAPQVVRTFTVTKAPSTIHFADRFHIDNGSSRSVSFTTNPGELLYALLYADSDATPSLPGLYEVTASLDDPLYSGSGSTYLSILGLRGRGQRLLSGSDSPQEANGTDFGRVVLGRVATQTFTITNPGAMPLTLDWQAEVMGENASDFQISVAPAAEIPAGGSVSFEVRFAPTQPGDRDATVVIACDALANGPITFAVGGFGSLPTLLAQTLTFNLPSSLYLSQSPVPLVATASSGLPVTLSVLDGPATIIDGQLQVTEPGKIRIEARQAGFGNFMPAKPVVRTLTVKADPTGLTLADLIQTYNGTPRPITVLGTEEEAAVTYLINKEASDQPPTNAGSYPVTVTAGPVTKKGTLVIARAPLIVQVTDQRKLVGEANPDVSTAFTISGFVLGDNELNSLLPRPITVTTKAKDTSPPGLYAITSSGGGALNYTLIHRAGTLVVEGHVGSFEALLRDPDTGLPAGLLKLTVPSTGLSLTANLALAGEAKPIALAGPLALDPETRVASAQVSRIINKTDTYQMALTLSLFGELTVEVRKNDLLIAQANDGTRLRDAVKGLAVPQSGAYTAVLEPGDEDNAAPPAPGWATAKLDAAGRLALAGRLGDGTAFTASLPVGVSDGYRFFVQPYKRAGAHLGGAWSLTEHPEVEAAWQARGVDLTWVKGPNEKDPGYRAGFGPLTVALEMDAWQPASKIAPLAQLLGVDQLNVSYDSTGSPSEAQLASRVAVDASGALRVLAPVTNPLNVRKWTAKVNPATGAYSGSFELFDLSQKRKVNFTGVLRQAVDAEGDGLQGRGLYILPPLKGAVSTETTTARMEFRRPD
jgi:formylglycine-generating enzyme required for sulfatase activity